MSLENKTSIILELEVQQRNQILDILFSPWIQPVVCLKMPQLIFCNVSHLDFAQASLLESKESLLM